MGNDLLSEIQRCTLCEARFAATETGHKPRPVVWFNSEAPI
ncbi:MAG: uracil-DNA glycosylase family protein, partial [Paracoccaceae bacterium]|nr:uracil-DNA glycosylase family protein [Paracoccaceae bacterium]